MVPLLFIHSMTGALIAAVPIGLMGGVATAAYLDLIIRSCPRGLQGTTQVIGRIARARRGIRLQCRTAGRTISAIPRGWGPGASGASDPTRCTRRHKLSAPTRALAAKSAPFSPFPLSAPAAGPIRAKGWDNVKNNPWNSMGRTAEVGHDKSLMPLICGRPPRAPPVASTQKNQMVGCQK
jgi:hypothetical protein